MDDIVLNSHFVLTFVSPVLVKLNSVAHDAPPTYEEAVNDGQILIGMKKI